VKTLLKVASNIIQAVLQSNTGKFTILFTSNDKANIQNKTIRCQVICEQDRKFISVINQLDAHNFCFTIRLFRASTCLEHMCSKRVEA